MARLFLQTKQNDFFKWTDVRSFFVRTQYNELLKQVLEKDVNFITDGLVGPPYLNKSGKPVFNYYDPTLNIALVRGVCNSGSLNPGNPDILRTASGGIAGDSKKAKAATDKSALSTDKLPLDDLFNLVEGPCSEDIINVANLISLPSFLYDRFPKILKVKKEDGTTETFDATLKLDTQINFGSVLWLYYYERMGIFEILKVLMNDYNYTGKFPISSKAEVNTNDTTFQYSSLMDAISTLYRLGIGSNLLDRKALYQRALGVVYNPPGEKNGNGGAITTERNDGFMRNFNKLIGYTLDFFRDKQLAQAIRDSNNQNIRSSVATQTGIRDTIQVLQKNFEVLEYGRNRTNTFIGIATVFATICLLRMLKDEIGVPRQFNDPHEFIPAAYDILVTKTAVTQSESNRFTIFDNCASYGFRLLADIELIDPALINPVSIGSVLDAWLNDIEGNVEGYNNAVKSIPETERSMATSMS